ncbi:MAG: GTP 3',8-cyclase [Candidatus Dichloromethanomonas elyunquensis]|nr:MAG: GTP 3',8-cyclase [Candidatus Dichloromethanomonas elyunquensis]
MIDNYGRKINYLRVSVTDLCNLRCAYCMPAEGIRKKDHCDILNFEEIENIVRAAVLLGIDKVRITGGEPLVRNGIVQLVESIARIKGLKDLSITTNGIFLKKYARDLKRAGLHRVNISLDSLDKTKYKKITHCGELDDVLEGIIIAEEAGFSPVKINVVLMGGYNDDEIEDFVSLTLKRDIEVRFIELMPLGEAKNWPLGSFISNDTVLSKVPKLVPLPFMGHGTVARMYKLPNARGRIGLISPLSCHFCNYCNRVRVTSDGKLKPCLHSDQEIDLKNVHPDELKRLLYQGIRAKPTKHRLNTQPCSMVKRNMNEIGG